MTHASRAALTALLESLPEPERAPVGSLVRSVSVGSAPLVAPPARGGLLRRRRPTPPAPPPPTTSYLGGHPFLPPGEPWPRDHRGRDLDFVAQVSFAEVTPVPGFPTEGLLQVFTAPEDGWLPAVPGAAPGTEGLHLRWFGAERLADAASAPASDTPAPVSDATPVETPGPHPLRFEPEVQLPLGWENLEPDVARAPDAFAALARLLEEDREDLLEPLGATGDVRVGGWPSVVQGAPRVPPGRSAVLLLELHSTGLLMWGDVGTAQVFGDPGELAAGRLDGLWWDWAC